jgi:hypothetical protein
VKKLALALLAVVACSATWAASPSAEWTLEPESSQAWPVDPYFGAVSSNPYDIVNEPFRSVDFIGFQHPGGSTETLGGGHLVYRWRLDFDDPVEIISVTMVGFGDQRSNSQQRLLDAHERVIASQPLMGYNTLATNVLKAGKHARGVVFILRRI